MIAGETRMTGKTTKYIQALRIILWIYIILCVIIAGVNYGYAPRATEEVKHVISWIWLIYENWVKTIFIAVGAFLTLRIVGASRRDKRLSEAKDSRSTRRDKRLSEAKDSRSTRRTRLRKQNLIGFIVAALAVHVITPLLVSNYELYFFAMPLPWTTTGLQLLDSSAPFYHTISKAWGLGGIGSSLIVFAAVTILVYGGTLLFGRRLQCSTLCLFNGFAAEVFDPVIPLIGKRRQLKPGLQKLLRILRWVYLAIAIFFVLTWVLSLAGIVLSEPVYLLAKVETYKYLAGELLLMMFFWIAFIGRGYCYICPLGTTLSFVSIAAGQRITTDSSRCIKCTKCNTACPMSIDIMTKAIEGKPVRDTRCVGCGHCVDTCPTENLRYTTRFLEKICGKKK